jgi:hypothetical protein
MIFRVKLRRAVEFEILVEAQSLPHLQRMLTELSLMHDDENLMTDIVSIHEAPNLFTAPTSSYWQ